ncbi:hypothetical protein FA13DRAFT_1784350 [Coprinellus micaceus]|uniref:Uncharacterized protein n=1 Tax=Coprinellus micaceus TaxID=71717 RepID=A0A4Y7U065_COPMI|nr:hypothetical protein FA13DRAFT_1784350 [Coprinellus micaceus]
MTIGMVSHTSSSGSSSDTDYSIASASRSIELAKIKDSTIADVADNNNREDTASRQVEDNKHKKGRRRGADTKEENKYNKEYENFLQLIHTNDPLARSTFTSMRTLQAEVRSLSNSLSSATMILAQLVSDVKVLQPAQGGIPPLPVYNKQPTAPSGRSAKRQVVCAIAGLDGPIKDKDLDDGYDSGDDDFDPFIEDDQWHPTWGFLIHRKTGEFIGHDRIGEISAFIKSGYICMARIGKLERTFTVLPLDTRTIMCNAVEDNFHDWVASSGHYKSLQALQEMGSQIGLSNLIKQYGGAGFPIPPTPSGSATPFSGSSSNPIIISEVAEKLQRAESIAPTMKIKTEDADTTSSKRSAEDPMAPTAILKRRRTAVFSGELTMPLTPASPSPLGSTAINIRLPPANPTRRVGPPSGLVDENTMPPPSSTSAPARPVHVPVTPANPQMNDTASVAYVPHTPLPAPCFDTADTTPESQLEPTDNEGGYTMDVDPNNHQFWTPGALPSRPAPSPHTTAPQDVLLLVAAEEWLPVVGEEWLVVVGEEQLLVVGEFPRLLQVPLMVEEGRLCCPLVPVLLVAGEVHLRCPLVPVPPVVVEEVLFPLVVEEEPHLTVGWDMDSFPTYLSQDL